MGSFFESGKWCHSAKAPFLLSEDVRSSEQRKGRYSDMDGFSLLA